MDNRFWRLLPHLGIILSLSLFALLIFDHFNGAMVFIDNDITKGMLAGLVFLVLIMAGRLIYLSRRK